MKHITIIAGHYGSGKTEFAVNLAFHLKQHCDNVAVIDLDIVNPYFRSREVQPSLEAAGIRFYGNAQHCDTASDEPAVSAAIRAPLEDETCMTVLDAGGSENGVKALNPFRKYFAEDAADLWMVINANRPETSTSGDAIKQIREIEKMIDMKAGKLINNTHLLRRTTTSDLRKGYEMCRRISANTGIDLHTNAYAREVLGDPEEDPACAGLDLFPMELYFRPSWLDRQFD